MFSLLLAKHLWIGLLDYNAYIYVKLFSKVIELFYIPNSNIWDFRLLCQLTNIWSFVPIMPFCFMYFWCFEIIGPWLFQTSSELHELRAKSPRKGDWGGPRKNANRERQKITWRALRDRLSWSKMTESWSLQVKVS